MKGVIDTEILSNFVWEAFQGVIDNVSNDLINAFILSFTDVMSLATFFLETTYVKNAIALSIETAGLLLGLKVAAEALKALTLYENGEPVDPGNLLIRVAISVAIISTSPWVVKYVYELGTALAGDVATLANINVEDLTAVETVAGALNMPFVVGLMLIVIAIMWAFLMLQMCKRAIEIVALAVTGPFMAIGILSPNLGAFEGWKSELIVQSVSQALQMFLIKGALVTLSLLGAKPPLTQVFVFIGWLWVALSAPSWLRQRMYSAGLTGAVGGAAQQAGSMVVMRKIFTKGV